ncbi:hypothetical protein Poli38472_010247 [Pythium oligandrum]|uniref:BZIP domain-containing protein n=1 Tax=Pythium oligandrum TaxID=41045 RepID=A0A8K1C9K8_PYTOL|nr:hypothetical protein Poli38472_010247 [Pythium oligandrum]|eukprot:TMW58688.1 hypothetical protein Poli38472_010247 [Pythium oligandrum]
MIGSDATPWLDMSDKELSDQVAMHDDLFPSDPMHGLLLDDDVFPGATDLFADDAMTEYDTSDALTDAASEMSTPPPCFDDDRSTPTTPTTSTGCTAGPSVAPKLAPVSPPHAETTTMPRMPVAPQPLQTAAPFTPPAMLPFAFPVACFPPLNLNQKRPLPEMLPNPAIGAVDASMCKKSKREIRQMKNRESANRSRMKRKNQLSEMAVEVDELTKTQHELQNTIAALRAENKSLHDQNAFLRSLVTMYSDSSRNVQLPPVPQQAQQFTELPPLPDLENGSNARSNDEDEELEFLRLTKKPKSVVRSAATVSAASLGLCASVFGLTILTDSDNGATHSGHVRRAGRVLHSLPSSPMESKCMPTQSWMEWSNQMFTSSWNYLATSDLAYAVIVNVISFIAIMVLYHMYQRFFGSISKPLKEKSSNYRWEAESEDSHSVQRGATTSRQRRPVQSSSTHLPTKHRSVSWQDVRVVDGQTHMKPSTLPHMHVFS